MNQDLSNMIIETPNLNPHNTLPQSVRFIVSYSIPSSEKDGLFIVGQRLFVNQPLSKTTTEIIKEIRNIFPQEMENYVLLLKYNNILFEDTTLADMEIKNDAVIELECLEKNKQVTHNEGFFYLYWSMLPMMFAISFGLSGLMGKFDFIYKASYVLASFLIGIPSLIFMFLGSSELFPVVTRTSIVGRYWFCQDNPCDCSCSCCHRRTFSEIETPLEGFDSI
ncbi:hypothetical protein TVAG_014350 [Trichomonas vaginalis G3]|uniref:Ubiquitin-like domain-containing protein n=1 Tax=Trichomonas vaginalis (strain ATCC PRA-98 / G3) TaxID=412133 RepID=A2DDI9_TRIV3|nr:hypothetical protein TVAGG3_0985890 [Trichomonas vaginalis G3]EAY21668.1 hypothetical protein TVAG_014350 [Trichomonas vaginalis G3]KAI5489658.1 hypothetical protein TVAGG3_0985890 [Trichomonas vaginalis G3]|eukprot:XP_001582654.1 hypothetical protein [Trichomonas vaginalis G3]